MLQIANHLCPGNIVVSGHTSACDRVPAIAEKAGAMKTIRLAVAGAFHTPLMQPAVQRLAAALAHVPIKPPRIPVISNVDALSHDDPHEIRHLLVQQVVSPVRWEDSMRVLLEQGLRAVLGNRPRPRPARPAEADRSQGGRGWSGVLILRLRRHSLSSVLRGEGRGEGLCRSTR